MFGFAWLGGQWVACEVVQSKGAKVEVAVNGYHYVMFAANVRVEVAA